MRQAGPVSVQGVDGGFITVSVTGQPSIALDGGHTTVTVDNYVAPDGGVVAYQGGSWGVSVLNYDAGVFVQNWPNFTSISLDGGSTTAFQGGSWTMNQGANDGDGGKAWLVEQVAPLITASGTITAPGQTISLALGASQSLGILILGTWSGTLVFEASADNTNWGQWECYQPFFTAENVVSSTTLDGFFTPLWMSGVQYFRVRASAFTSGTATITMTGALAGQSAIPYIRENGSPAATYSASVAGWDDGGVQRVLKTASDGTLFSAALSRPCACTSRPDSFKCSTVTNVAKRVPQDGGISPRSYIVLYNRANNTGNFICTTNGNVPSFGATESSPGVYIAPGDRGVPFSEPDIAPDGGADINCISDTPSGSVLCSYECACSP
ncbi:MAG: hypothetical protein KGI71_05730 [Patescibacteria group bacterium]|nr:hypothetical protein [Patescibacteria group bacterium]